MKIKIISETFTTTKTIFELSNFRTVSIIVLCLFIVGKNICQTETWKSIGPTGVSYNSTIKYDPNSNRFYMLGYSTLFKSNNNGDDWINISSDYLNNSYETELVIRDKNPNELYYLNSGKGIIYKSTDAGSSWNCIIPI